MKLKDYIKALNKLKKDYNLELVGFMKDENIAKEDLNVVCIN